MTLDLHFDKMSSLTLWGSYMDFDVSNTELRTMLNLTEKEQFDVSLKIFVTNDHHSILGTQNGFLGIGPCPR